MSQIRRSTRRGGESQQGSSSRRQIKRQRTQDSYAQVGVTQQHMSGQFDFPIVSWAQEEEDNMWKKIKYYQDKFTESCDLNQRRRTKPEEEELLTGTVLRFVLFHNTKEPGVPITRPKITEVVKDALPEGGKTRGFLTTHVITRVQAELASKMGLELKQLIVDKFVVQSLLPRSILEVLVNDSKDDATRGFILLVLAIIRLSNDKVGIEDLWQKLSKFDIHKEDQIPEVGVASNAIQSMIRKKYLREEKKETPDGFEVQYELGEQIQPQITENEEETAVEQQTAEFTIQEIDQFIDEVLSRGNRNNQVQIVVTGESSGAQNAEVEVEQESQEYDDDLD